MSFQVEAAKARLSHASPYAGTGLRRQQSAEGAWLEPALERGRQIADLLSKFRTNEEGYGAITEALGIKPRQARSYLKLWSLRPVLEILWDVTEPDERPRSIEQAIDAAQNFAKLKFHEDAPG